VTPAMTNIQNWHWPRGL